MPFEIIGKYHYSPLRWRFFLFFLLCFSFLESKITQILLFYFTRQLALATWLPGWVAAALDFYCLYANTSAWTRYAQVENVFKKINFVLLSRIHRVYLGTWTMTFFVFGFRLKIWNRCALLTTRIYIRFYNFEIKMMMSVMSRWKRLLKLN